MKGNDIMTTSSKIIEHMRRMAEARQLAALSAAKDYHRVLSEFSVRDDRRFMVRPVSRNKINMFYVWDSEFEKNVFQWYGAAGEKKCMAVANALNYGED